MLLDGEREVLTAALADGVTDMEPMADRVADWEAVSDWVWDLDKLPDTVWEGDAVEVLHVVLVVDTDRAGEFDWVVLLDEEREVVTSGLADGAVDTD